MKSTLMPSTKHLPPQRPAFQDVQILARGMNSFCESTKEEGLIPESFSQQCGLA